MNPPPRFGAFIKFAVLVAVCAILFLIFPSMFRFAELAARELRYLWWMVLLLALGAWLIWGLGKKR